MTSFRYFFLLLFTILMIRPSLGVASHINGVEITYECINACTVRVDFRSARHCGGGPIYPNPLVMSGTSCTEPVPITGWSTTVYTDITPLAPPYYTSCTVPGGIGGLEEAYSYRLYDWCAGTCNEVLLGWSTCCRNAAAVNITNVSLHPLEVVGVIMSRPGSVCNNSPQFHGPPVFFIPGQTESWFDMGATDAEGDSLIYQFYTCSIGAPAVTSYNLGFSALQPLGPNWNVSLNGDNGLMHFVPNPGSPLLAVICYEVEEYRNGIFIGKVQRDFVVATLAPNPVADNLPPSFDGISMVTAGIGSNMGTYYSVDASNSVPLVFELATDDADTNNFQQIEVLSQSPVMAGAYLADVSGTPMATVSAATAAGTPSARWYWPSPTAGTYTLTLRVSETGFVTNALYADTIEVVINILGNDDVWPGDANDDLVANNLDLLTVALGFGDTGPVRPGATNIWIAQSAPLWGVTLPFASDEVHADCDGNGTIGLSDVPAILLNYGLTHPKNGLGGSPVVLGSGVPVYCEFLVDSASVGDTVEVGVFIGDSTNPANNVYGVAFTFNYSDTLVDSASVRIQYDSTWFAGPNSSIYVSKDYYSNEKFEVGYARINHLGRSGMGQVATITLVLTDNIDGKVATLETKTLLAGLSAITLIDANGDPITVALSTDSLVVYQVITDRANALENTGMEVSPNPARDWLDITLPEGRWNLKLIDLNGRTLQSRTATGGSSHWTLAPITPGVYFLRAENQAGIITRKIIIQ